MARSRVADVSGTGGAVIYVRVSTSQQAEEGVGLEAQEARCQALATLRGLPVLGVYQDAGVSGKEGLDARPGLAGALEMVRARPGSILIVYSVSRLARRQRLLWALLDPQGADPLPLVSASEPFDTSTPMGRAMLGMIAVWSQLEADMVSERTRDALAEVRARGVRLGAPRMIDRVTPEALNLIQGVLEAHVGEPDTRVAGILNKAGIPTVRGAGQWWGKTVRAFREQLAGGASEPTPEEKN